MRRTCCVHCSWFDVTFRAAHDFFSTKKYFVFVDETATPMQILSMAKNRFAKHGERLLYTIYRVVFSLFHPYFAVVHE